MYYYCFECIIIIIIINIIIIILNVFIIIILKPQLSRLPLNFLNNGISETDWARKEKSRIYLVGLLRVARLNVGLGHLFENTFLSIFLPKRDVCQKVEKLKKYIKITSSTSIHRILQFIEDDQIYILTYLSKEVQITRMLPVND